jgi:hypothetical protein
MREGDVIQMVAIKAQMVDAEEASNHTVTFGSIHAGIEACGPMGHMPVATHLLPMAITQPADP